MIEDFAIHEKWTEFKTELQKTWAKLTGEDLDQTGGDEQAIGGMLEKYYGEGDANLRVKLNEWLADFRRRHKEQDSEPEHSAEDERHQVTGALRDQYRQF